MTEWMEIAVAVEAAQADEVAPLLAERVEAARRGIEIRGNQIVLWVELPGCEQALGEVRRAAQELSRAGFSIAPDSVRAQPALPELEWRDAWKRHFRVTRVTRQIVIVPSWERHAAAPDDVVLDLDPGQAFGTGTHASTRLVLEEIQALRDGADPVGRFCDVGCGSGILSIAAARLWPSARGHAVDIDPLAVDATRENVSRNGVADRVTCALGGGPPAGETWDLVLANIQASVLYALSGALIAATRPGGLVVLSGLLSEHAGDVAGHYQRAGADIERVRASDVDPAWSAAVLRVG